MDLAIAAVIIGVAIFAAAIVRTYGEKADPVGRFQFHAGPDGACKILNTRTGAMWERAAGSAQWVRMDAPWAPSSR